MNKLRTNQTETILDKYQSQKTNPCSDFETIPERLKKNHIGSLRLLGMPQRNKFGVQRFFHGKDRNTIRLSLTR